MTSSADRLSAIYPFSQEIIDAVSVIDADADLSYEDFLAKHNIGEPAIFVPEYGQPVQVLDLVPARDYDSEHAAVLHLPMASGLTPNKIVRAAALHLARPDDRLIVIGNPGIPLRDGYGKVGLSDLRVVSQGNLSPVIESSLQYLKDGAIRSTTQYGYSFGADRAAALSARAPDYDVSVVKGVFSEPAAIVQRGVVKMVKDFMRTGPGYRNRIAAIDTPLLRESRQRSENESTFGFSLLRLSNIAIVAALAKDGFSGRLTTALSLNPEMHAHVLWGDSSEIIDSSVLDGICEGLKATFPDRVKSTCIKGQDHSMADDIALHAAIMLHGAQTSN